MRDRDARFQTIVRSIVGLFSVILIVATTPSFLRVRREAAHAKSIRQADNRLTQAVRAAQYFFDVKQYKNAKNTLETALADPLASDRYEALQLMQRIAAATADGRRQLVDESQTDGPQATARHDEGVSDPVDPTARETSTSDGVAAEGIWDSAQEKIRDGNFAQAMTILQEYANWPNAKRTAEVGELMRALSVITSPDAAQRVLLTMSETEYVLVRDYDRLPSRLSIDNFQLVEPYVAAIRAERPNAERIRTKESRDAKSVRAEPKQGADRPVRARRRDRVLRSDDGESIAVCANMEAYNQFTRASSRGDVLAVAALFGAGRAWEVRSGTRVRELDPGVFSSEIEVLEGQHRGKRGIVATEFLHW